LNPIVVFLNPKNEHQVERQLEKAVVMVLSLCKLIQIIAKNKKQQRKTF